MNTKTSRRRIDSDLKRLIVIIAVVLIWAAVFVPSFFRGANFSSMCFQFPEFGLFAMGMAMAMLCGGCDLSVVNIGNLSGIVTASFLIKRVTEDQSIGGGYIVIGIIISLAVGALCGLLNGVLIAKVGIPAILATLGGQQLFGGIGIVITKGSTLHGLPESMLNFGNGSLGGIIPWPAVVFVIMLVIIALIIQKHRFGKQLLMMGSNSTASKFSGLNNTGITIKAYVISGILGAVAGLIILSRTNSANSDYGSAYVLQTMLVAIMAGFNPNGGKGKITTLFLSIIILQFLSSGLNMLNVSSYLKQLVYGVLLLVIVITNSMNIKIRKPKVNKKLKEA